MIETVSIHVRTMSNHPDSITYAEAAMSNHTESITYSDEEDSDGWALSDWREFVIRFGKFKGQTVKDLVSTGRGRGYLRYILSWPDIRPETAHFIKLGLAHYSELKKERDQEIAAVNKLIGISQIPLARTDSVSDYGGGYVDMDPPAPQFAKHYKDIRVVRKSR